MQQQNKVWPLVITIVGAIGSFLLSRVIWPDLPDMAAPVGAQLPLLIGISAIESLAFGIGLAFLISGWRYVSARSFGDKLVWISATWLLVSWWPHDNMHRVNPMGDYWGLIRIEWIFHFTLIIAGIIVASFIWKKFSLPHAT